MSWPLLIMESTSVKQIPLTTVLFDGRLAGREIPSLRGSIMNISGNDPLFHNHSENAQDINRYPRIQYKIINGHPSVVGIAEGSESLPRLFLPGSMHVLKIGRDYREFVVKDVVRDVFSPSLSQGETVRYHIHKWLPFNSENFEEYLQTPWLVTRVSLLDKILTGNILSLYKDFGLYVEDRIVAHVIDLEKRDARFKGIRMLSFDAVIETNFALPEHCGIGKGVSIGFGVVTSR